MNLPTRRPLGKSFGLTLLVALALALASSHLIRSQSLKEKITRTPSGQWQLSWSSTAGEIYLVQRSADLKTWTDVRTVTATGTSTTFTDSTPVSSDQVYWRLRYDDGSGPVLIMPFSIIELVKVNAAGQAVPNDTPDSNWRITWESLAGVNYIVQRSGDAQQWADIANVTATETSTSYTDLNAPDAERLLWRVVGVGGNQTDVEPPQISIIQAQRADDSGGTKLKLTVVATDDIGVTSASFTDGGNPLPPTTDAGDGRWTVTIPYDPAAQIVRVFQAEARDASGKSSLSPTFTINPTSTLPSALTPIGADGQPVNVDGIIGVGADGQLAPFALIPDGNGGNSASNSLRLDFTSGGKIVTQNGQQMIEATEFVAGFGADSILQFDNSQPGVAASHDPDAPFGEHGLHIIVPDGQTALIPIDGGFDIDTLRDLLSLPPDEGLPVLLFDRFSLQLLAGELTRFGIEGARWALGELGLPLPDFTGEWEDGIFDLLQGEEATFPVYGEIELPDNQAIGAKLLVSKARPLTLTLKPNGGVAIDGPATLEFDNGVRFTVSITLDDPIYRIGLEAQGLEVPLIDSLAAVLPDNPENCIPGGATDAELDEAERCLIQFQRAYHLFTLSALARRPESAQDALLTRPPGKFDTAGAIAQAWGASAATPLVTALPLQEIRDFALGTGRAAAGASDFKSATAYLNTLVKVRAAIETYPVAVEPGGQSAIDAAKSDIDSAVDEAIAAAVERSKDPEAISSLDCMLSASETILETWALRDHLLVENQTNLRLAVADLLVRFETKFFTSLGIEEGVFEPSNNPIISGMNRYTAITHVRTLLTLAAMHEIFTTDGGFPDLWTETIGQVFHRAEREIVDGIEAALEQENVPAVMFRLPEALELIAAWINLAQDQQEFLGLAEITGYAEQMGAIVAQQIDENGLSGTSLTDKTLRIRALLELLRSLPTDTLDIMFGSIEGLHEQTGTDLISARFTVLNDANITEVKEYIQAATAYTRIGRQYTELTNDFTWEGSALTEVIDRIGLLMENEMAWSEVDGCISFLLEEAERLEADGLHTSRKLYYQAAVTLLHRQRSVAQTLWTETEALRAADPELYSADGFLPGDLHIDRIYGSLTYNRRSNEISGAFGGELSLPKLNSQLIIENSRITSGGVFEINAHGQLLLPEGNPVVTMSVPRRSPLHVQYTPETGIGVSGKARFEFSSGIYFETGFDFDDPLYFASLEAGGLYIDLSKALAATLPDAIPLEAIQNGDLARLYTDYYNLLASCMETNFIDEEGISDRSLGSVPKFTGKVGSDLGCGIDAWACLIQAEASTGRLERYDTTFEAVDKTLKALDSQLKRGASSFNDIFGNDTDFEVAYHLARLGKINASYAKIANALEKLVEAELLDSESVISLGEVRVYLDAAAVLYLDVVDELLDNETFLSDWELVTAAARAGFDLVGSYAQLGIDDAPISVTQVTQMLEDAEPVYLETLGLRPDGSIDTALINTMGYERAGTALRSFLDVAATIAQTGGSENLDPAFIKTLLDRQHAVAIADLNYVSIEDQFFPGTVSDTLLKRGLDRLVTLAGDYATTGSGTLPLPDSFNAVTFDTYARLLDDAAALPIAQWRPRFSYLQTAARLSALVEIKGGDSLLDQRLNDELFKAFKQMVEEGQGRFAADEIDLSQFISAFDNGAINSLLERRLQAATGAIDDLTDSAWTPSMIRLGNTLGEELLVIEAIARTAAINLPQDRRPATLAAKVDDRFIELATSIKRAKPLTELAKNLHRLRRGDTRPSLPAGAAHRGAKIAQCRAHHR